MACLVRVTLLCGEGGVSSPAGQASCLPATLSCRHALEQVPPWLPFSCTCQHCLGPQSHTADSFRLSTSSMPIHVRSAGTIAARGRVLAAGAIMSSIALFLLIMVCSFPGVSQLSRINVGGRSPVISSITLFLLIMVRVRLWWYGEDACAAAPCLLKHSPASHLLKLPCMACCPQVLGRRNEDGCTVSYPGPANTLHQSPIACRCWAGTMKTHRWRWSMTLRVRQSALILSRCCG